jgi:hypothetical protein
LQVRVRGKRCECFCDGQPLFQYEDPKNAKGAPALGTFKTAARFKNIRVTDAADRPLWEGLPDLSQVGKPAAPVDPKVRATLTNRGEWAIEGTEIVQKNDRLGDCELVFGDPAWTDYNFVCEAKVVSGRGEVSETFRVNEAGRYEWVIGRWTYDCESFGSVTKDGLERVRWRKTNRLEPGRWYKLEVRVRGKSVECLLDRTSIFTTDHGRHSAGRIGIRTYGTQARFRDLKVTDPSGTALFEGLPDLPAKVVDWLLDS